MFFRHASGLFFETSSLMALVCDFGHPTPTLAGLPTGTLEVLLVYVRLRQ